MGTTLTTNWSLVKPDVDEPATNWDNQNATNMDIIDADLKAQIDPIVASSDVDVLINASPEAGSTVCGLVFTVPPSQDFFVTVGGDIDTDQNTFETYLGYEIRSGPVIGAGTILNGFASDDCVISSSTVSGSAPSRMKASRRRFFNNLAAAGSVINIRTIHDGSVASNGSAYYRELVVEMILV